MNSLGLRRRLCFEDVIDSGQELLFNNIKVYNAASQYRNGFFYQPPLEDEIADPKHDDRHERALAQMTAAAAEFQQASEAPRQQARTFFQEAMPGNRGVHQSAAAAAPAAAPATATSPRGPMQQAPQSFASRLEQRGSGFKTGGEYAHVQANNRLRQEARQKADRQSTIESKRVPAPRNFNIATPSPSPPQSPREVGPSVKLQARYDERLIAHGNRRQPQMANPRPESHRNTDRRNQLKRKRESAEQIAKKRSLPPDRSTLRKRKRTEGDRGRQRN